MELSTLINFVSNYGFMVVIMTIGIFFGYKYLNLKFKVLEKNLSEQLKPHFWEVDGGSTEAETENGKIKKFFFTIAKRYQE